MHEREAFRAIFSFGGTLESLEASQVSNRDAAIKNAREFAGEILTLLRENSEPSLTQEVA
jgi:chromosome partitioning protein